MLDWVIAYPGDWHMLSNYQYAMMKSYFDAGLKDLAAALGYPTSSTDEQISSSLRFVRLCAGW